jgi:hypothetical protein
MRRLLALSLISSSLVLGGAGGLAVPAALAAGTGTTATQQPTLNLSNAEQNAADAQSSATQSPVASTSSTSSSGLSSSSAFIIGLIGVLVLGGISFYIWRLARSDANALGHHASDDGMFVSSHAGSKPPRKSRKPSAAERKRRKRGRAR